MPPNPTPFRKTLPGVLFLLSFAHGSHAATIAGTHFTMWQEYSAAPLSDGGGTPGWLDYLENMKTAATSSGFVNSGNPATPGYFEISSGIAPLSHFVVTGPGPNSVTPRRFPSWRGMANPGSVFGSAFANEYGSRLHSPLLIVSNGGPFTMTSLERKVYSEAYVSGGPWQSPANLTTWSAARIGVTSYGGDGVLGGGDDTYITSGTMSATPILAFMTTGLGTGQNMSVQFDGSPWPESIPDDEIFDNYSAQWDNFVWDYRMDYKVNYQVASVDYSEALTGNQIDVVPEPSVWAMTVLGCFALFNRRRLS